MISAATRFELVDFLGGAFVRKAESVLDGFQDRFALSFLAVDDRFAVGAAQGAEFVNVPLHEFQGPHAALAEILVAFGTVKRGSDGAMVETGECSGRRRQSWPGGWIKPGH